MIITDKTLLEVMSRDTSIEECKELDLFGVLENELNNSRVTGVGLSSIQIGLPLRACIIKGDNDKLYRIINPVIIEHNDLVICAGEGCLSCPGIKYNTDRYNEITTEWIDFDTGHKRISASEGLEAFTIQHEVDHMSGILNYKREHKAGTKIGRNEPCPCNSGKKYKRCCGRNL